MALFNHQSTTNADQRDSTSTPVYLFQALNHLFNFDIDLCATHHTAKCYDYYTPEINALKAGLQWGMVDGHLQNICGWCNPPYSNIKPWIDKAINEAVTTGFKTVILVPADHSVEWWPQSKVRIYDLVGYENDDYNWCSGRPNFIDPSTNEPFKQGINKPMVIIIVDRESVMLNTYTRSTICVKKLDGDNFKISS